MAVEPHAWQAMQPDSHDHGPDLWLRITQPELAAVDALPARQHRQVDHQRRICKHQLPQLNGHIAIGFDRARERPPPVTLRRTILVSSTAQYRRRVIELDDPWNLHKIAAGGQVATRSFPVLQSSVCVDPESCASALN